MRFYYFSSFSWIAYWVVMGIAIMVLWLLWTQAFKLKMRHPVFWILVVGVLLLPWSEELWIAYNFDRLCRKDAGVFINRTVEVDGFYDDTTHWWRQLQESPYQFVESREYGTKNYWRVERVGNEVRHFKIDRPTARYQYKTLNNHTPVTHQITRFEDVVLDNQTGEVLARYTNYYRGAYWFFVSLDRPTIPCEETRAGTREHGSLIYRAVLKPSK